MSEEILESVVLKSISNNLMVKDVDETLTYYTDLGFEIVHKSPASGPAYWAYVKKDHVELFFQSTASLTEEFPELESYVRGGSLTLWFHVNNISKWYEEIKDKTKVIRPFGITPYNGAKEFVIMDLNGFILHFSDFDLQKELNKNQTEPKE
ncbi:MAG: VOC family protein [Reichenbachiella sp.]